jgi:hypothetical protein
MDKWTYRGHDLGECYFDPVQDLTYIHIPKNASTFIKRFCVDFEYSKTFKHASKYLVILRDPIERWVSGMAQLIQSDTGTNWTSEYIFNNITLDDHTEIQCYFLKSINFEKDINKCIFFKVDENLSDKFIGWTNTVYPKVVMHKTKLNMGINIIGRIEIIKNLQKIIDNNADLMLKLKKHFDADYELINRVKFYGN